MMKLGAGLLGDYNEYESTIIRKKDLCQLQDRAPRRTGFCRMQNSKT